MIYPKEPKKKRILKKYIKRYGYDIVAHYVLCKINFKEAMNTKLKPTSGTIFGISSSAYKEWYKYSFTS